MILISAYLSIVAYRCRPFYDRIEILYAKNLTAKKNSREINNHFQTNQKKKERREFKRIKFILKLFVKTT